MADEHQVPSAIVLQWGHHFAVVDTGYEYDSIQSVGLASMGPPLCSGGYDESHQRHLLVVLRASMGPPLCSGGYADRRPQGIEIDH